MIEVSIDKLRDFVGRPRTADEWFRVDQKRIDDFADVTMDHQFIHVDPERASQTAFGSTIAHGLLTLSLLPKLIDSITLVPDGAVMGINYGFNKVRLPEAVKVNSELRATMTLREIAERAPGQLMLRSEIVVEIRGQKKPALVADSLALAIVE